MRPTPTTRQLEIIRFISAYAAEHSHAPTMREIADELGVSKTTVFEHVGELKHKGWLTHQPHKFRSLRLLDERGRAVESLVCVPMALAERMLLVLPDGLADELRGLCGVEVGVAQ